MSLLIYVGGACTSPMDVPVAPWRFVALLLVAVVLLSVVPAPAAAATRAGGTVVVESGETVDGLTVFGGSVVVRGTVNGDLSGFAGDVTVAESGTVTGDLSAAVGSLEVLGTVDGDVSVAAGSVVVGPDATVGGSLSAGAGSVTIAGEIAGDVSVGADSVRVLDGARVSGRLEYDAESFELQPGATVEGGAVENPDIGGPFQVRVLPGFGGWLVDSYLFAVNLLLGAVLLAVFPGASRRVADTVTESPVRTGVVGLLALVGVPLALVLIAITVVGIPITVVGLLVFALVAWAAYVWGNYAVGAWLLSLGDYEGRWAALFAGLVAVALVGYVPVLGGLTQFAVLLLGLGALVAAVRTARSGRRESATGADAGTESAGGSGAEPTG